MKKGVTFVTFKRDPKQFNDFVNQLRQPDLKTEFRLNKEAYMETITAGYEHVERCLRQLEPYEEKYNQNIFDMTTERASETIAMTQTDFIVSLRKVVVIVDKYCEWAVKMGISKSNPVSGLKAETIDKRPKFKETMFFSEHQLAELILNKPPIHEESVDSLYVMFYWGCFMGLLPEQILDLKTQNIDIDQGRVVYDGNTYNIPPLAMPAFRYAKYLDKIVWTNGRVSYKIKTDYVMATNKNRVTLYYLTTREYQLSHKYLRRSLNWQEIFLSGEFLRLYNGETNIETIAAKFYVARLRNKKTTPVLYKRKIEEMTWWYNQWKDIKDHL